MRELVTGLARSLEQGREAVMAVILEHAGSTPRGSGSMMAVYADGSLAGSVGGGPLEGRVLRRARELFDRRTPCLLHFDLGAKEAAREGMVCGGEALVLLDFLPADPACAAAFRTLADSLAEGRPAALGLHMLVNHGTAPGRDDELTLLERRALGGAPRAAACNLRDTGPDSAMTETMRLARRSARPAMLREPDRLTAVIPLAAPRTAVLFGAGHVSLHTARLAASVGFRTIVLDDRPEFANARRFPEADEVRVAESFTDCLDGLPTGPETFLLILTRGHLHDKTVLAQALDTEAGYIGMIGSRRKRDATYKALLDEGADPEAIRRVHCPIGLSIDAETPEEIAVSIVAEMIQVRAALGNA